MTNKILKISIPRQISNRMRKENGKKVKDNVFITTAAFVRIKSMILFVNNQPF